jgi:hypothetical protein
MNYFYLYYIRPTGGKGGNTTGKIKAPHANKSIAIAQRTNFFLTSIEPFKPVGKPERIILTKLYSLGAN